MKRRKLNAYIYEPNFQRGAQAQRRQDGAPKKLLKRINDLPAEWWIHAANGQHGYNYRTEVTIAKEKVVALLDGGSGINSVTE